MQDQFYIYILKCANGAYYVGHTDNMEQRLSEHHLGAIKNCYTKDKRPLELMFVQAFQTRDEAFYAERQLKGWSRKKKEAFMKGDWEAIKNLNHSQKKNNARALEDILQQVQDERRGVLDLCLLLSLSKYQDEQGESEARELFFPARPECSPKFLNEGECIEGSIL